MEKEIKYTQTQTAKETGMPQSTLSDMSKKFKLGETDESGRKYYTISEVDWIKEYKVKNHNKIIDIIKKYQPIPIKELIHRSEFTKDKTLRLLTEITGTLDDPPIDANIWEDENEKLFYGDAYYKRKFFGEY